MVKVAIHTNNMTIGGQPIDKNLIIRVSEFRKFGEKKNGKLLVWVSLKSWFEEIFNKTDSDGIKLKENAVNAKIDNFESKLILINPNYQLSTTNLESALNQYYNELIKIYLITYFNINADYIEAL